MRCPGCNADNPPKAVACEKCGGALARKPRKRPVVELIDSPFGPVGGGPNRRAFIAYRWAVVALIPFVGLVAGPMAFALGANAWLRDRQQEDFSAWGPLNASLVLGGLAAVTNWVGLALMLIGVGTRP
jgi:hypothetical protein